MISAFSLYVPGKPTPSKRYNFGMESINGAMRVGTATNAPFRDTYRTPGTVASV